MNDAIEGARLATRAAPMSYAQQRLWLLDRLLPSSAAYNSGHALRLSGTLDVAALRAALNELACRHEVLRTRFAMRDGQPVQEILPQLNLALPVEDLQECAPDGRESEARRLARMETTARFDLEGGPLIRARLLRLAPAEHWLLLTVHHIVTDGWSSGVLTHELTALYAAFSRAEPSPLAPLPMQYADYARWQLQWLQGTVLERQLAFWRRTLAGLPALELPSDRPRPAVASGRGGCVRFEVAEALTRSLKQLSRSEGATLFMTLLAAFQILLYRYSGQEDLAVGVPTAGRLRPEFEKLIGFFVNMLVLRGDLSGSPGFAEYLGRVRERALDAYSHQDLPFEKLVEELAPRRDLSRNPLFQVSLALQNTPRGHWALPGLEATPVEGIHTGAVKFDLALNLTERRGVLAGGLEYASDLYDAAAIERMAGHFVTLLEGIAADPRTPIDELPLLTPEERRRLLGPWSGTRTGYPKDVSIPDRFEALAARRSDAMAVAGASDNLTYGELNARANRLAHHLRSLGAGSETLTGICMERSPDMVVAMLGVLKAGGAYVPLDPNYPPDRLAFMLEDSQVRALVTQRTVVDRLPRCDARVVCLDGDAPDIAACSDANPAAGTPADALACVIYTSGSTGTPKGVMVPHRGVVRLVCDTDYIALGPRDCVAQVSNPAFDAATFEIWGALLNGARLAILGHETVLDPPRLASALRREGVTAAILTTALFNMVVRCEPGAFAGIKHMLFGGEAADPRSVRECLAAGAPERLLHMYGPAEAVTFATWHRVQSVGPEARTIPIGRPIANMRIAVLDRHLQPVPIGVTGELYIGGEGLAPGYWRRPELTEQRFVADPLAGEAGARMYRTGDLVRGLPDGSIEFVGRADRQLKLRGFRVEPGEIESVLIRDAGLREALVVLREDTPGDKRLVAYVVGEGGASTADDLRALLKTRLPDYMVPAAFVALPALPLTANGKIDRDALPPPAPGIQTGGPAFVAPRDDVERILCGLWADSLDVPRIGIDDDFFDAGGHSLLAARLFAQLDRALGRRLPLATLFSAPTVRELARFYRDGAAPAPVGSLVPITSDGDLPPLFAVPGIDGDVLCFAALARRLGSAQPFFGLRSVGVDGASEPLASIEQMAAQNLRELRRVQPVGPYYLLGACFGAVVAFEMARQLVAGREQVAFLGLLDPSSLQGSAANRVASRVPSWLSRGIAFAKFVAGRLELYRDQLRPLGFRQRMSFLGDRVRLVREAVAKRDAFRGDRSEFHRSRVHDANLRALLAYRHEALRGNGSTRVEIFGSARDRGNAATDTRVDWSTLTGRSALRHRVPGRDSGDMLSGENAGVLAALLAIRLEHARRTHNDRADAT